VSFVGDGTAVTCATVGAVLSTTTEEEFVVEVTSTPGFVAESEKLIVKVTTPSVSPVCTV